MPQKLCALSVDVDPLTAYYEIHGLGDPPRQVKQTIVQRVLPRFRELLSAAGIPATFFVVGRDIERSEAAKEHYLALAEDGHELANHTYSHPYELCRLPKAQIVEEIVRGGQAIAQGVGEQYKPTGFRAPGYFINGKVLQVLEEQGYAYDSSMFPSPPYYLAKAAVLFGMTLRGRRSASVLSDVRGLTAPADPYYPDSKSPWRKGTSSVYELPVAVLPWTKVPAIGTLLAVAPDWLRELVLKQIRHRPLFNLELHGIDLADAIDDRIPTELAGRQPDLRVPFREKRDIFLRCIERLKQDYEFVTLREAAQRLAAS